jgi:hypothetical protein
LAGAAVQIAPCSAQIPCKQGILQGISAKFEPPKKVLRQNRHEIQCVSRFFPAHKNREFSEEEQGMEARDQAIWISVQ